MSKRKSVNVKESHPKLTKAVEMFLIDLKHKMPFYGQFNLSINFHEDKNIPTCGTNVTSRGMNFYYNPEFLDSLNTKKQYSSTKEREMFEDESQKMVNFMVLHENFHLLFNHPQRTVAGKFDPYLSNIAQDMIINSTIWDSVSHTIVSIPKYPETESNIAQNIAGKNMALFIPKEYVKSGGEPIFEELYTWLRDKKEDHDKNKGEGDGDQGGYGENGQAGDQGVDSFDLNHIFENMDNNEGQYMDSHMYDTVPEELRESMVNDQIQRLRSRGLISSNIEQTLMKLRKKRKDYLKDIKRSISNDIVGKIKSRTMSRPNRRGIKGIKGNKKMASVINVLLDTSGSMGGTFEKVLEYVFQKDIEINICQVDTEVHKMERISSMKELQSMNIEGLGGTILQPGIDLITDNPNYNKFNTVILTDGWCDTLDMSRLRGKVLGVTIGDSIPISQKPRKGYKEIVVEKTQ